MRIGKGRILKSKLLATSYASDLPFLASSDAQGRLIDQGLRTRIA